MSLANIKVGPNQYDDSGHNLSVNDKIQNLKDFIKEQPQAITGGLVGTLTKEEVSQSGKILVRVSRFPGLDSELVIESSSLTRAEKDSILF